MEAAGELLPGKELVMRILRRAAVLILLGLTLGAPWAGAAPPRPAAQNHLSSRSSTPKNFLSYLSGLLTSFWLKGGCTIDPNGRCAPGSETGCTIDPNGRCTPRTQNLLDGGCTLDPDGGCIPDR